MLNIILLFSILIMVVMRPILLLLHYNPNTLPIAWYLICFSSANCGFWNRCLPLTSFQHLGFISWSIWIFYNPFVLSCRTIEENYLWALSWTSCYLIVCNWLSHNLQKYPDLMPRTCDSSFQSLKMCFQLMVSRWRKHCAYLGVPEYIIVSFKQAADLTQKTSKDLGRNLSV